MNNTTVQRNIDLMSQIRRVTMSWQGKEKPTLHKVLQKVLNSEAPSFYVNYETAYRYVGLALRDKLPMRVNGMRRRQWNDIAERVRMTMARNPSLSIALALLKVLEEGKAPSFYLSYATAQTIYYTMLSRKHNHHQGNFAA